MLSRKLAWIVALAALLLPGAIVQAHAPAALANPCNAAPATGVLATTTNRPGLIDLYYFRP